VGLSPGVVVSSEKVPPVLWSPAPDARETTRIGAYLDWLATHRGLHFDDYGQLWRWSVDDLEAFWASIWDFFDLGKRDGITVLEGGMPGTRWFVGANLNYADHALAHRGNGPALVAESQTVRRREITWDELHDLVSRARTGLRQLGVGRGDRVAAYLPNIPETIVGFLATASLGAIWSSCAPEFGPRAVVDRFRQIEPKVLLVVDGYRFGERSIDLTNNVREIRRGLPTVTAVVEVSYLDRATQPGDMLAWEELTAHPGGEFEFEQVPFDHPLYILFSSGTTGLPKPIVHGHGGILIEHLKTHALLSNIGPDDRFFWFTTTGWMMWNHLVSHLLVGATLILFDGDPAYPDLSTLWRLAADTQMTWLGASAGFFMSCRAAGLQPGEGFDLSALRAIGSTGSPLPSEGFHWIYEAVGDVFLSSVSGGTDICSGFVGGSPLVPVWAGEISCRYLGVKVEAFDENGTPVIGQPGELVVTKPMPSMPVGFWGDESGERYLQAYFDTYPGVWRHGDWITITERGSCIISGRSDATLNRGGVRLGTSDFYAVVGDVPGVVDSLVVHLEDPGGTAGRLVLLVQLAAGVEFDEPLKVEIRQALSGQLSPRHVPDEIYAVPTIPMTISGKKLELPVKRILAGANPDQVVSRDALRDPSSLDPIRLLAVQRA
jgi:acetoacetyl-CoA synthetase